MDTFKIIYTALGGLALFFYGMRNMTDGLQAMGSNLIKRIINSLTSNRILAVLVGLGITTIVQSSSVSTVMVVGFVNAGLMSLTQAIGVIFGANIGTTITGWIISIKVGKYGLLIIALSIYPVLFAKRQKYKNLGRILFGMGLIFLGLSTMSGAFKPLRTAPGFLEMIHYFSGQHYGAYLASIMIGCLLTMLIQSSSAMLGITIAMAVSGVIEFHTAAALVLGENIGTTITALLASIGGNINAKRAAYAHAGFNLLGVFVMILIFPVYINFIDAIVPGDPNFLNAEGDKPNIAFHIATGHSIFNVTATLIFLPFLNVFASLITRLTPEKAGQEAHHLTVLGDSSTILPATAIIQAQAELKKMNQVVADTFSLTRQYFESKKDNKDIREQVAQNEDQSDIMQKEITLYMCKVMEKRMTPDQSSEAQVIVRVADELESLVDYLDRLVFYGSRLKENKELKGALKVEFFELFSEIEAYYNSVGAGINDNSQLDEKSFDKTSDDIKLQIDQIREKQVTRVGQGDYSPLSALTYSDMVVSLRKIRSHTLNIAQALYSEKVPKPVNT